MTKILTHRGLDPLSIEQFPESSYQAFKKYLDQGYGLEFDVAYLADDVPVVIHDKDLIRTSEGKDNRKIHELKTSEFKSFKNGQFLLLTELLQMISSSKAPLHALHFKGHLQNDKNIKILADCLTNFSNLFSRLIVFDLLPESAIKFRKTVSEFSLACSIAREYDRLRYNSCVSHTLMSLEKLPELKNLFNWVWLDEWDVQSASGARQELYTQEVFDFIRHIEMNIAIISPELHATSPSLLGGEAHSDASDMEILTDRLKKIIKLSPDAICTDYPHTVSDLIQNISSFSGDICP